MIDGTTKLYSNATALDIIDKYKKKKQSHSPNPKNEQQTEQHEQRKEQLPEQPKDWEMIAKIYEEQLHQSNIALQKALDSLDQAVQTKQILIEQLEQVKTEEKQGFWARLFNRKK